jgi:hypothetical protein
MPHWSKSFTRFAFLPAALCVRQRRMSAGRLRCSSAILLFLVTPCLLAIGCASGKNKNPATSASAEQHSDNATPGPDAKIKISYARPGDFLSSMIVTEYSAAETVLTESGKNPAASIIRFEAGVVVWQIGLAKTLLGDVPLVSTRKSYAVPEVVYGKLPANFTATVPDSGPPQSLQADHYYVFAVTRASGATSYEAVKVNGDGSLQAYAAEPRAGDSFRLCCDLAADFVVNASTMNTPGYP